MKLTLDDGKYVGKENTYEELTFFHFPDIPIL